MLLLLELPPPLPPPLGVELDALWLLVLMALPLGWGVEVPEREDMVVAGKGGVEDVVNGREGVVLSFKVERVILR